MQKWPFPHKMPLLQLKFGYISFKMKTKFLTHKDFMNIGYYPWFYSSLRDKKWRNGDILKIIFRIACIFIIFAKFIKYIENILYFLKIHHLESCKILDDSQPPETLWVNNFFYILKERHPKLSHKKGTLWGNGHFCKF